MGLTQLYTEDKTMNASQAYAHYTASKTPAKPAPMPQLTREQRLDRAARREAVIAALARQFYDSPYSRLCHQIVAQAVRDIASDSRSRIESALAYLRGDIPHAEAFGVHADYVRRLIKEAGLWVENC